MRASLYRRTAAWHLAAALLCMSPVTAGSVWYVNVDNASGPQTGSSWSTAFPDIQQGIDAAFNAGGGEVWVADGVYVASLGILLLQDGVDVYGGFAGTETVREQRNWATRQTIIDGSAALDGGPAPHVVIGANARFDGFQVTGGGLPQSPHGGGGMLIQGTSCTVANSAFYVNGAVSGGGILVEDSPAVLIERCTFYQNSATTNGGAINVNQSTGGLVTIRDCYIFSNVAGANGGGLCLSAGNAVVSNCVITANGSDGGMGGGVFLAEFGGSLVNCTIMQNNAASGGGLANFSYEVSPTLVNSILWSNFPSGTNAILDAPGTLQVRYSCVEGGFPGVGNINMGPLVDSAYAPGFGSPCIDAGDPAGVPPAPPADIRGVPRPRGPRVDMGAFEVEFSGEGEGEGEGETFEATLLVHVRSAATEAEIGHAVVRIEPGSLLSGTSSFGTHMFRVQAPAAYQLFVTANGYSPATRTVSINTAHGEVTVLLTPGTGGSVDSDGDGITDFDETTIYGTNPNNPDTDGDGMSDLFEIEHGLNPLVPNEDTDADGDRITDLEEFHLGSDPNDPNDPRPVYYVSAQQGPPGDGSMAQPYRSIAAAIQALQSTVNAANPAALLLLSGTYDEDVELRAGFELADAAPPAPSVIRGTVHTAAATKLLGIQIQEPARLETGDALLTIEHGTVRVRQVRISGAGQSRAVGVRFAGPAVATALLTDCVVTGVALAIEVEDAIPRIRRTQVLDSATGMAFRDDDDDDRRRKQAVEGIASDAADPNAGWNHFAGMTGKAAVNERSGTIKMENNDWDTDNAAEVASLVEGPIDFEPFLPKGAGLLPSSVTCVVWDAGTRARVTNAAVSIAPGGYEPVTANVDGVYTIAAVPGGTYTVRVAALAYPVKELSVQVQPGQAASLVFALGAGGPAPDVCGCFKAGVAGPARRGALAGNLIVVLAAVLLPLLPRERRRP